ncbi:MAG: TonB C-terminal domain-containing protein [Mariprofundaceae bacterium]
MAKKYLKGMYSDQGEIRRRWSISLTASVLCHLLLAVLLVWKIADQNLPKPKPPENMDVVLLDPEKKSSKALPDKADAISNKTARGGNNTGQDRLTRAARSPAISPQQLPHPPAPQMLKKPSAAPTPEQRHVQTLSKRKPAPDTNSAKLPKKPKSKRKSPEEKKPSRLENLMPSRTSLAKLSSKMDRKRQLKKLMSRQAEIPINTREVKYAPYAHAVVQALEEQWRPGQANYSAHSEHDRQVLMKMTIEGNGDLGKLEMVRPSPIPSLNKSAVEAIHAASPFKPLPSSWGLDRVTFYLTFEVVEDRFVFRTR